MKVYIFQIYACKKGHIFSIQGINQVAKKYHVNLKFSREKPGRKSNRDIERK